MKPAHYLFFAMLIALIFTVYANSRLTVVDADTPAFLMLSAGGTNPPLTTMTLTPFIYGLMPNNMLFFKLVACLILLACTLIVAKTGELVDKEWGWLAGILAFSNALWLPELLKLEEQSFAYPLVFLSFYFCIKWLLKEEKHKFDWNILYSIGLLLITALIWKGAYILSFLYAPFLILSWFFLIPAFAVKIEWWWNYFTSGWPLNNNLVQENLWGFGIIHNWSLLLGALTKNRNIFIAICFTLLLSFFSQKYTLYSVPFLVVGLILWLKDNPAWKPFVYMIPIAMIIVGLIALPNANPTDTKIQAIKETIKLAGDENVLIDWGSGWWLKYFGGHTNFFAYYPNPDYNNSHGYGLTVEDTNCKLIKDYNQPKNETLHLIHC